MRDERTFRRRRVALGLSAAILLRAAQHETPRIGTISITLDKGRTPHIDAALAPPLDAVAALVLMAVGHLTH